MMTAQGRLDGRVAIVTGATRGLGLGIARRLAEVGATVVCTARDAAAAQAAASTVAGETGARTFGFGHDVASLASSERLVEAVLVAAGRIDVLVNNAGISSTVPFLDMTEDDWDRVHDVNLKGVFLTTRAVAPVMVEQRSGRIVNISSMVGKEAEPEILHYSSSKAGVISLTQGLARELAPYDLNVNAVCPGIVRTPMWEPKLDEMAALHGTDRDEVFAGYVATIPLGRPQDAEDIGAMVAFLASDLARNITGQSINVCGGVQVH
jgi:NAD(P)-dependent dehydrogenase (short-subunit alcohol dehydrogenase family)